MNKTNVQKDLYINEPLRQQIVDFLVKKTGLEWYYFIKIGDIIKNLKPYILDYARCFSELSISFDSQIDFDNACHNCFEERGKLRLSLVFTEEEYKTIEALCQIYELKAKTYILFILITAIVNQNKKLSIKLDLFTHFFMVKGNAIPLLIPKEIADKLLSRGFNNRRSLFLRKALFYQIYFDKIEKPENTNYFMVTPEKTHWIRTVFFANKEIKEYINKNTFGELKSIALLHCINTYLDNLNEYT